ncbi:MAG TPA: R.Pab1 family restriction endonuclease [Bacilli bacterium]|nr:R.Pab1 family restriction endonuclease [Bacilli bacterium]
MDYIKYNKKENSLELIFLTKYRHGLRLRWKKREDNLRFGYSFKTTEELFDDNSYLEWLISYGFRPTKKNNESKNTDLDLIYYNYKNEKMKTYELSEIVDLMKQVGLISLEDIKSLKDVISENTNYYSQQSVPQIGESQDTDICELPVKTRDVTLPGFSYFDDLKGLGVEVSVEKQQFASGVQPMVYVVIPIKEFIDYGRIIGKTSNDITELKFEINISNKHFFLNTFKCLGMCSESHKYDVISILENLIQYWEGKKK